MAAAAGEFCTFALRQFIGPRWLETDQTEYKVDYCMGCIDRHTRNLRHLTQAQPCRITADPNIWSRLPQIHPAVIPHIMRGETVQPELKESLLTLSVQAPPPHYIQVLDMLGKASWLVRVTAMMILKDGEIDEHHIGGLFPD